MILDQMIMVQLVHRRYRTTAPHHCLRSLPTMKRLGGISTMPNSSSSTIFKGCIISPIISKKDRKRPRKLRYQQYSSRWVSSGVVDQFVLLYYQLSSTTYYSTTNSSTTLLLCILLHTSITSLPTLIYLLLHYKPSTYYSTTNHPNYYPSYEPLR